MKNTSGTQLKPKPVIIVQGGQWGSEAKGMVAASLGISRDVDFAVRTGTVNAGHTVMHNGHPIKMQQLPTGWQNPNTHLVIGAGAFIHPEILEREINLVASLTGEGMRLTNRLFIDYRCGMHYDWHTSKSKESGRHHKMGATGKGCSEAVMDKIRSRGNPGQHTWGEYQVAKGYSHALEQAKQFSTCNTEKLLNDAYDGGRQILIEGTQGTLLDLHLGPYPYTTHKQTQAANWLAECGLSCTVEKELVLVCRTFPIRVAGNSGPMPGEMSWVELARDINRALIANHQKPRVSADSIVQFEHACADAARDYGLPHSRIHSLTQEEREGHQKGVSELHARALAQLSGEVVKDLERLFEMTTVTKKLRRIARWDRETMDTAFRLNRPTTVILTFMNYLVPTVWDKAVDEISPAEWQAIEHAIRDIEADHPGIRVDAFSTGARNECLIGRFVGYNAARGYVGSV